MVKFPFTAHFAYAERIRRAKVYCVNNVINLDLDEAHLRDKKKKLSEMLLKTKKQVNDTSFGGEKKIIVFSTEQMQSLVALALADFHVSLIFRPSVCERR